MNIKDFAPTPDGKFSPNLYKRLAKHERRHGLRVFHFTGNRFDGKPTTPGVWNPMDIWIGSADDWGLSGNSLRELISDKFPSMGWAMHCGPDFYREITDEFWETYRAIGRCAWDPEHHNFMQNTEHRFTVKGDRRRCNWCGKCQRSTKKVKVTRRIIIEWHDEPTAQATA